MIRYLVAGFAINFFTSIDDALTDIPVLSASTRTNKGRIAFSLGTLLAVTVAVVIAFSLSQFISFLPHSNIIVALLVFIMAIVIYFNLLSIQPPQKISKSFKNKDISSERFAKLVVLGFFMTFTTMLDDIVTLAPLFLGSFQESLAALVGIYSATFFLIFLVIYFAKQITAIPHKREIATVILIVFGFLLLFGIV